MNYSLTLGSNNIEIRTLADGIFRVRMSPTKTFKQSLMERYNIINEPDEAVASTLSADGTTVTIGKFQAVLNKDDRTLTFLGCKTPVTIGLPVLSVDEKGFHMNVSLDDTERLYGLGDVNRESLNKRGMKTSIWIKNVISYGPSPYVMSSRGWAILINTTYRQEYDLGATNPNQFTVDVENGGLDFYVFLADKMTDTLELYTRISGRPIMLPRFAYGMTNVCNEEYGAHELLNDCMLYRKSDIPCDVMGLEPGWMEKWYDFTVDKKWDTNRFYMPTWHANTQTDAFTFFYNLRRMGFKLSLWLCCDYDLLWEEEQTTLEETSKSFDGATIFDEHFGIDSLMDKITKMGEPWFEHLKKFVDNGASAFKLDGANQICEHPDRLWAGHYTDDEVHNVYPVIYAKQMKEGFTNYTGRRAMIYTPAFYVGTQKYAATWAGDTGGGYKTLVSILNLALSGNVNTSCDMDVDHIEGIHYGFLMPWSQTLSWRSWSLPWLLGDDLENAWKYYAKLRSSLFPYIYSTAHNATKTGMPIARPMCLAYPEEECLAEAKNMYMFGDSLLVAAFDMKIRMPEGKWRDLFTGDIYDGGTEFTYQVPEGRGGGLFAKAGSVWVIQEPKPYLDSPKPSVYTININPGADCSFTMVEDDGVTYGYLDGEVAETKMYVKNSTDKGFDFVLKQRVGGYTIKSDIEYDIVNMRESHESNVQPLPDVTEFKVAIYADKLPKKVILAGKEIETSYEDKRIIFTISKEAHEAGDVKFSFEF